MVYFMCVYKGVIFVYKLQRLRFSSMYYSSVNTNCRMLGRCVLQPPIASYGLGHTNVRPNATPTLCLIAALWNANISFVTSVRLAMDGFLRNLVFDGFSKSSWDRFKVCRSVHHRTIQIDHQTDATIFQFIILTFICSSTCFGRSAARRQELSDCSSSLWFYLRVVVTAVLCSWSGRWPDHEHSTIITTIRR